VADDLELDVPAGQGQHTFGFGIWDLGFSVSGWRPRVGLAIVASPVYLRLQGLGVFG
jgi:hypothetical protein